MLFLPSTLKCPIQVCKETVANNYAKNYNIFIYNNLSETLIKDLEPLIPNAQNLLQPQYLITLQNAAIKNISFRYAVVYQHQKIVAFAAFQIVLIQGKAIRQKQHNQTLKGIEKLNDWVIRKFLNSIYANLLVCGNVFITGDFGYWYTPSFSQIQAVETFNLLINEVKLIEKNNKKPIQLVMLKDFKNDKLNTLQALANYGFKEVMAQPNMILTIADTWKTFNDYLQSLISKYRVRAKNYQQKGKLLQRKMLSLQEINDNITTIYTLYLTLANKAEFNLAYITPKYIVGLKKQLANNFDIMGYYLNNELIACISIVYNENDIEAHFIGYKLELNHEYAIYGNILYDLIDLAIQKKAKQIIFGRTAMEIKSTVGAKPVNENMFVSAKNPVLHAALPYLFNKLRTEDWIQRKPFKDDTNN